MNKLKKKFFFFLLVFCSILVNFFLGELFIQFYLDPLSGTYNDLGRIYKKSYEENLTISQYAKKEGFDRIFVGSNASTKIINQNSLKNNLILGDSVTGGHGLNKGESFGEILAKIKLHENTHIWHVDGGGIDQLFIKTISEAQFLDYDKINIAFIEHDVLRAGTRFIYSSTKIKFEFENENDVKIILAQDLEDFYNSYIKAKNNFYLSIWYLKKYYASKEHFFPNFFPKYYKKLFEHIAEELNYLSEKKNIKINLIMLPNSYSFKGNMIINEAFKNIMNKKYSKLKLYDLSECSKTKSLNAGIDFYKEFNFHPGRIGHEIIASCFVELID